MIDEPDRAQFSVWIFWADGTHSAVAVLIKAGEAVRMAQTLSIYLGPADPTCERIIVTNGGDDTVFEWKRGEGVTFPPRVGGDA